MILYVTDLPAYVDSSAHISEEIMERTIRRTEDLYIRDLLGGVFYTHLDTSRAAGYLTDDEEVLVLEYIVPYLAHRFYQEYLPSSGIFMTGMGPRVLKEETSEALDVKALEFAVSKSANTAGLYLHRLMQYLKDNADLFPDYVQDECQAAPVPAMPRISKAGRPTRAQIRRNGYAFYDTEKD